MNVSFIGLGVMGFPMAGHLQKNGFQVTVYNRTTAKAEQWVSEYGGEFAKTPGEAAAKAEYVLMCIGNDNDIRSVVYEKDGVFEHIKPGSVLVDHTTASAEIALELKSEANKKNCGFLDAPVSGGQSGAESGQLTIMAGGEEKTYQRVSSLFDCYAKKHLLMGPNGHGQLTKMVNQICISGILQGLSEGLLLTEKSGLDAKKVFDVISKGAAQSWQMDNRAQTMIEQEFNFGFAVDWMIKDLGICLDPAKHLKIELPLTQQVKADYETLSKDGGGRADTSSLCKILRNKHDNSDR